MKRTRTFVVSIMAACLAVLCALVLAGCAAPDAVDTPSDSAPAPIEEKPTICGYWELTDISVDGVYYYADPGSMDAYMQSGLVFNEDGTGFFYTCVGAQKAAMDFEYALNGSQVELLDFEGNALSQVTFVVTYEDDTVVMEASQDGQTTTLVYSRVDEMTAQAHMAALGVMPSGEIQGDGVDTLVDTSRQLSDIVGTWSLDELVMGDFTVTADEYRETMGDDTFDMRITFMADGSGIITSVFEGAEDSTSFTYELDGDTVVVRDQVAEDSTVAIAVTFDDKDDVLTLSEPSEDLTMRFQRVTGEEETNLT